MSHGYVGVFVLGSETLDIITLAEMLFIRRVRPNFIPRSRTWVTRELFMSIRRRCSPRSSSFSAERRLARKRRSNFSMVDSRCLRRGVLFQILRRIVNSALRTKRKDTRALVRDFRENIRETRAVCNSFHVVTCTLII